MEMLKNEELKEEKTSIVDEKQKEKEFIEPEKTSKNRPSVFDQLQTPVEEVKDDEVEGSIEDALGGSIDDDEDSSSLENNFEDLDEDNMDGLFEDHKLMAELGVEIIDMAFTYGCMAIANDKDEAQWTVSAARRNRLKKPLGLLLKNREAKVKPEVMVLLIVLSVYAPMLYKAIKMKMAEAKRKKEVNQEEQKPPHFKNWQRQEALDKLKFQQQENPIKNQENKAPFQDLDKDEKRKKAYLMKKGGANTKDIQDLLNIGESTVYKYVKEYEETLKKP